MKMLSILVPLFIGMSLLGKPVACETIMGKVFYLNRPHTEVLFIAKMKKDSQELQELYEKMKQKGVSGNLAHKNKLIAELKELSKSYEKRLKEPGDTAKVFLGIGAISGLVSAYGFQGVVRSNAKSDTAVGIFVGGSIVAVASGVVGVSIALYENIIASAELKEKVENISEIVEAS